MFTNSYITIHTIFLHTKEERLKNRDFFSINVNAIDQKSLKLSQICKAIKDKIN